MTVGMFRRQAASSMPGTTLSQLGMITMASKAWPFTTHSTLSAMTSRLVRLNFMPSWFMAMPSHTPMVVACSGVPPAMRTPAFTASAMFCKCRWPGMISFCDEITATSGRASSSSVRPSAFSKLRCGPRAEPTLIASLLTMLLPMSPTPDSIKKDSSPCLCNLGLVTKKPGASRTGSAFGIGWLGAIETVSDVTGSTYLPCVSPRIAQVRARRSFELLGGGFRDVQHGLAAAARSLEEGLTPTLLVNAFRIQLHASIHARTRRANRFQENVQRSTHAGTNPPLRSTLRHLR